MYEERCVKVLGVSLALATLVACEGPAATPIDAGTATDSGSPAIDAGRADAGPVIRPDAGRLDRDAGMPAEASGCGATALLASPDEPEARGPWAVGARTVTVGRLTVEVLYPAAPGSEAGAPRAIYDLRAWLPPSQQSRIPDADNPWQICECARGLPLDEAHGPYPVVAFVHGTAAFRTQSLSTLTHWASRGFVVVSADHPGLFLGDLLALACPDDASGARDLEGDVAAVLGALSAPSGELAFLRDHIDVARVGLAGHSAGGAVAGMTAMAGVRVVIGLSSGNAAMSSATLESSLFVAARQDRVVQYDRTLMAFGASPSPRRFLGIEGSGHLAPSDLCDLTNADGQNLVEVATEHGICGASFGGALYDCEDTHVAPPLARAAVDAISTAVLEEALHCRDRDAAIAAIETRLAVVHELRVE